VVNADLVGAHRTMACWAMPTQAKLGTTSKPNLVLLIANMQSNQLISKKKRGFGDKRVCGVTVGVDQRQTS